MNRKKAIFVPHGMRGQICQQLHVSPITVIRALSGDTRTRKADLVRIAALTEFEGRYIM